MPAVATKSRLCLARASVGNVHTESGSMLVLQNKCKSSRHCKKGEGADSQGKSRKGIASGSTHAQAVCAKVSQRWALRVRLRSGALVQVSCHIGQAQGEKVQRGQAGQARRQASAHGKMLCKQAGNAAGQGRQLGGTGRYLKGWGHMCCGVATHAERHLGRCFRPPHHSKPMPRRQVAEVRKRCAFTDIMRMNLAQERW